MDDHQLLRYSRHILLPELGVEAQNRWLSSHVLIIGAGGLGCAAGLYLGAAGVGALTLVDDDCVDLTNLQRQIAHTSNRVGQAKVDSLRQAIQALNPNTHVQALAQRADRDNLDTLVKKADVVVDCSDNFATRQATNAVCVRRAKPLVSGAATGWDAQLSVHLPKTPGAPDDLTRPCYACIFPPQSEAPDVACATMGVFAPLVGIVGSMQAAETLKLLAPTGTPVVGRLLMLHAQSMVWTSLCVQRDPTCSVCGP